MIRMFNLVRRSLFLGIIILLVNKPALFAADITIAIVDGVIDTQDPRLAMRLHSQGSSSISHGLTIGGYQVPIKMVPFFQRLNQLMQIEFQRDLKSQEIAEKNKLKEQINQSAFNNFIGFVHGHHVAGIALEGTTRTKIIPIAVVSPISEDNQNENVNPMDAPRILQVDPLFLAELPQQYYGLEEIRTPLFLQAMEGSKSFLNSFEYLKLQKSSVVNISLAMGLRGLLAASILKNWWEHFRSRPSDDVFLRYLHASQKYLSTYLYAKLMSHRDKLFVLAAGNWTDTENQEANNSDVDPIFPTSVTTWFNPPNILVVAATNGRGSLAKFSGYGGKTVHVAAPGVNIESWSPAGGLISLSGTSQAAPYVTNTAARMLEVNPHLPPSEIRKIILETVDKKPFLAGKVTSGGIVNPQRAIHAAKLRTNASIEEAIRLAQIEIVDI